MSEPPRRFGPPRPGVMTVVGSSPQFWLRIVASRSFGFEFLDAPGTYSAEPLNVNVWWLAYTSWPHMCSDGLRADGIDLYEERWRIPACPDRQPATFLGYDLVFHIMIDKVTDADVVELDCPSFESGFVSDLTATQLTTGRYAVRGNFRSLMPLDQTVSGDIGVSVNGKSLGSLRVNVTYKGTFT